MNISECLDTRLPAQNIGRTFKPFVMGADGTLGIHAAEVIDTLARKLTKQWDINNPNRHGAVRCWIFKPTKQATRGASR
jgi:hypothetical protein